MRRDRQPACRVIVGLVLLASALASGQSRAADIRVHATRDCADRADIADQVDILLNRPVSAIEGFDFEVDIAERPDRRWRLRLATVDRADGAKRTREIDGSGCAQLADAAAVAIAMSIQSSGAAERTETTVAASPLPAPPTVAAAPPSPVETHPLRFPISVAALLDTGALPPPGLGLGLGGGIAWRRLLIVAEATFLTSPEARVSDDDGGRFRLFVGAVLACLDLPWGSVGILGCAGGEAGIVRAEGIGIDRPRTQNVGWEAGRLDVGLTRRLNPSVSLFARGGVAVPWSRPTFTIINDAVAVHRPDALSARVTLGALFDLF